MKLLLIPGLWPIDVPYLREHFETVVVQPGQSARELFEQHKPAHVVAHSFGTLQALELAEEAQSLVLCCGFQRLGPLAREVLKGWKAAPEDLRPQLMRPWLFTEERLSQPTGGFQVADPHEPPQPKESKLTNVLIVAAQFDLLSTSRDAAELSDLFPHARVEILPSAHALPVEHPELLRDVLANFYRRQSVRLGVRQSV